jgi:UDP-glucose 4-epimerase
MNILVIGSKGFIGTHVFNYFSSKADVNCWGCGVSVDYVSEKYFQVDATNSDFNEIFETVKFDVCINCSGAASVPASLQNPVRDFSLNTYNVVRMLEAIRKHSAACKFVNLSSAAVYGGVESLPVHESSPCNPISPYGHHKLYAEMICKEFTTYFGLKTCSLRIFSAYGPGLKKQLLWDIYQKSLLGPEVVLFGTGKETRDYIYIDDIVTGINAVIDHCEFNANVYNVASGMETTVDEIAKTLLKSLGYMGQIKYMQTERTGDPRNWQADITQLKSLGFTPKIDINSGINKLVTWLNGSKL